MTVLPADARMIPGQGDLAVEPDGQVWKLKPDGWHRLAYVIGADSLWYSLAFPKASA